MTFDSTIHRRDDKTVPHVGGLIPAFEFDDTVCHLKSLILMTTVSESLCGC